VRSLSPGVSRRTRGALSIAAAVAFLALLAAITLRNFGHARLSTVANAADAARAESLYRAGSYRDALDAFRRIASENQDSRHLTVLPALDYNSGNALYRLGHYDESIMRFRGALAGQRSLQERSDYNLGDTYMKKADVESDRGANLRAAISAYEDALSLEPGDADARWNLELALRKLADVNAKTGAGRRRGANWGGGNLTKSGYAGAPQTGAGAAPGGGFGGSQGEQSAQQITETRARALLKAMERAQVAGQAAHSENFSHSVSRRQDW
jgi:tetratricopeptide (TPR) repeat protein